MPFSKVNAELSPLAQEVVEYILFRGMSLVQIQQMFKDTDTRDDITKACFEAVASVWGKESAAQYIKGTGKVILR